MSSLSPPKPLKAIVLYDGAAAPSNASSTFSQPIVGFYQAAASSPVAEITHIVGNGQTSKSENVYLNSGNLLSLYTLNGTTLPPFPGVYNSSGQLFDGSWDNPTWTVNVQPDDFSETTSVVPTKTNGNCVDWAAVILGGYRTVPAILAAGFLANAGLSGASTAAAVTAAGNAGLGAMTATPTAKANGFTFDNTGTTPRPFVRPDDLYNLTLLWRHDAG